MFEISRPSVLRRTRHRPFVQVVARHHHLADDFRRGEVADQLLRAGVAEGAGEGAADLGRDAKGPTVGFRNVDDFDLMPARDADQILARAIRRHLPRHHLGQLDHEMLGQQGAVILGQIGHRREIADAEVIDPLPDLPQPHLGLLFGRARRHKRLAQLLARQADDIGPALLPASCAEWSERPA